MLFVILGILLLAARFAGLGLVAEWSWWTFALPFVAAALWWAFSDATGATQRRAMRKMEERKEERRQRAMDQLGLRVPPAGGARAGQAASAPPVAAPLPKMTVRKDPRL